MSEQYKSIPRYSKTTWRFAAALLVGTMAIWMIIFLLPDTLLHLPAARADLVRRYAGGAWLCLGLTLTLTIWLSGISGAVLDRIWRAGRFVFYGTQVFFAASMVGIAWFKLRALHYYSDLGNNLEILWRETHGLGLTSPMFAQYHHGLYWFAAHCAPIAYLIAHLIFRWFPKPQTLFILMTGALLSGSIPIMLYTRDKISREAGYWIGAVYLLYPSIQFIGIYDFGFLQLCIPFLAWAYYALHKEKPVLFSICIALALLCREEVGLTVFALGLYVALFHKRYRIGLLTAGAGLAYSLIVIKFVIPSFRDSREFMFLSHYAQFGKTPMGIVTGFVLQPWRVLKLLIEPVHFCNLLMLFLPLQFFALLSPSMLLVTLPNMMTTFMTDSAVSIYSFMYYYISPSLPFLFFAAIDTVRRLTVRWGEVLVCLHLFIGALLCSILFGPFPFSMSFLMRSYKLGEFHTVDFHYSRIVGSAHYETATRIAALIPRDAAVSAEQPFMPLLYDCKRIQVFPSHISDVDYILIDRKHPAKAGMGDTYDAFRRDPESFYRQIEAFPSRWKLMADSDGVRLFQKLPMR